MKFLGWAWQGFALVCVGTTLSLLAMGFVLWQKGWFERHRVNAALSGLYGLPAPRPVVDAASTPVDAEQPSYEAVLERRALASLDRNLRESAIEKGLGELRLLETSIKTERDRFDQLRLSFDSRLAKLQESTEDGAIQETKRILESMQPKQAKEQLLKMLAEPPQANGKKTLETVVAIVKAMQSDKQKKLLQEFKTEAETNSLNDILREIREGQPDLPILKEARKELERVRPPSP